MEFLDSDFQFSSKNNGRNIFEFSIEEQARMTREAAAFQKKYPNQERAPKDRTNLIYCLLMAGTLVIFYLVPKFVWYIMPSAFKNDYSKIKQYWNKFSSYKKFLCRRNNFPTLRFLITENLLNPKRSVCSNSKLSISMNKLISYRSPRLFVTKILKEFFPKKFLIDLRFMFRAFSALITEIFMK